MALWSLTDRGSAVLSPITWCGRERKRQFGSSLNFQKSWWSCENWTNCSNATLILCYSKCKLVSQKIFLITLRRVNLVCGDSLRSPLRITLSHEPRWLVWSALDTGPPPPVRTRCLSSHRSAKLRIPFLHRERNKGVCVYHTIQRLTHT